MEPIRRKPDARYTLRTRVRTKADTTYAGTCQNIEMHAVLISTYEMGRQPFGLASPCAWLRGAGWEVTCVDAAKQPLHEEVLAAADLIAFHLPMHTATRLAAPLIENARRLNPSARICAYGLY